MKLTKLIKKAEHYLSDEDMKRRDKIVCLKTLMKKLSKKEKALRSKAKSEGDDKALKKLNKQIRIIRAQREKGVKSLKALKK